MGDSNELIEVALTVVIALAVGLTSASFGGDSPAAESIDGTTQMRALVDKVIQTLAPIVQPVVNDSPRRHFEI